MEDHVTHRDGLGADPPRSFRRSRSGGSVHPRAGLLRVKAFFGEFIGAGDTTLIGYLEAQINAAIEGTDVANQAIAGPSTSGRARQQMKEVEHIGDLERAHLVNKLHTSFMTPVDREDLYRLSRSIDDVLDNLRDFVREVDLMEVQDDSDFLDVLEAVAEGLRQLRHAARLILVEIADVPASALAAKKAGNHIRELYQVAIAKLLQSDTVTMDTLKKRELLRRLDVVGLRLGEAADALADGAMKRTH